MPLPPCPALSCPMPREESETAIRDIDHPLSLEKVVLFCFECWFCPGMFSLLLFCFYHCLPLPWEDRKLGRQVVLEERIMHGMPVSRCSVSFR